MELMQVVNYDGTDTGLMLDPEYIHQNNLFHREVNFFIRDENNRFLLLKNKKNNLWQCPKCDLYEKKTANDCIKEFLNREFQLNILEEEIILYSKRRCLIEANHHIEYIYYVNVLNRSLKYLRRMDYLWIDKNSLKEKLVNGEIVFDDNRDILDVLNQIQI